MIPEFDLAARHAELAAELATAGAALPALRAAHATAKTTAEDAKYRLALFVQRVNHATRHGADEASPALLGQLHEERRLRDMAAGVAERARRELANLEWRLGCLRLDLEQLEKLERPPPLVHHRPEIVKRPKPQLDDGDDFIVMPSAAAPAR